MKICIIGAGNLGMSIAHGLLNYNRSVVKQLIITRKRKFIQSGSEFNSDIIYSNNNITAIESSDIIILAVQPQQLNELALQIKQYIREEQLLVSTISNKTIAKLENFFGCNKAIIRCMPNIAISVGAGITCMSFNQKGALRIKDAEKIFSVLGNTLCIDDDMMRAATVICGSGVAFWMRLIRASTQAAIQLGFDAKLALHLSTMSCLGSAQLLSSNNSHPEIEIDKVTTPKGCTISGLNEMEHQGMSSALIKGLLKSFEQISTLNGDA